MAVDHVEVLAWKSQLKDAFVCKVNSLERQDGDVWQVHLQSSPLALGQVPCFSNTLAVKRKTKQYRVLGSNLLVFSDLQQGSAKLPLAPSYYHIDFAPKITTEYIVGDLRCTTQNKSGTQQSHTRYPEGPLRALCPTPHVSEKLRWLQACP